MKKNNPEFQVTSYEFPEELRPLRKKKSWIAQFDNI